MDIKIYGIRCINCGNEIPVKRNSKKYCSYRCCDNYLKKMYRKRNKAKINSYRRKLRADGYKNLYKNAKKNVLISTIIEKQGGCLRCGIDNGLEAHHIKPRRIGGKNEEGNVMILCKKCHYEFEELTKNFWNII